ncbi:aspartate/glutamate racemase family protein [Dokdonella sp.]|uniref:aspartate/glutamate racemase family protein n=1 Tax=Dokdonella sp. TaxID=2291710 RepID=UPI001B0CE3DE|nr:aspartate/glutamate racemase family protein [Dokdonella sp.]MBO9662140.1 aspartate/glutamate racemase family protein [Dokdonella sp.]
MRILGLLGGMSWESTIPYYRRINERVRERRGGLQSAELLLYSVDFARIEALQHRGDWDAAGQVLADAAQALQRAGAQGLVICTNTMHRVLPQIEPVLRVPVLHIADATAARIRAAGFTKIGLLGTRFTMEQDFYRGRLAGHGLDVRVPDEAQRAVVHRVIYEELCQGRCVPESRAAYRAVIADLVAAGAEAVILGCTEIGLLVDASDSVVPLFDTTAIHAEHAADWALAD